MAERDLKLQVIFSMVERVTAPLKKIIGDSSQAGKAMKALRERLKELDSQQKDISGFRRLHNGTQETAARLDLARAKAKELAEQLKATESPTRTVTREFNRATTAAKLIKEQFEREGQQLQVLRDKLHGAGISTQTLGQHERVLRSSIADTTAQIARQQQQLGELAKRHDQVIAAKKRMEHTKSSAASIAGVGIGMTVAGGAMGMPVVSSIRQAADYQQQVSRLRALGIGEEKVSDGVKFAKSMNVKGSSELENLKLLTEAHSILRDFDHAKEITPLLAKMKFGIEGVMQARGAGEGHGENAEKMFMDMIKVAELRGALKDMDSFKRVLDFTTQAYVASGGLVKPDDLLNMIKTGGVAAKQLSDDSFFFGMLHSVQELGGDRAGTSLMSAYSNWAQGRTTQQSAEDLMAAGLLEPDSVKYGKTGHITKMLPDALKAVEKYKTDPFLYMMEEALPRIVKPGMTDSQIISKLASKFSARKGGDLIASMYLERFNIMKHREAAKGSYGIDKLHDESADIYNGKYLDFLAKRNTLEQEFGAQILPYVNDGLDMLTDLMKTLKAFFAEHPVIAKFTAISIAALAGLLVVMGTLTLMLASIVGPFAIARYGMALLGVKGNWLKNIFKFLGSGVTKFFGLLPMLGSRLLGVARAAFTFGSALMANPVGLAIAAILLLAAAAYYLYHHWEPARRFFDGIWEEIKAAFNGGLSGIMMLIVNWNPIATLYRLIAFGLNQLGIDLPAKFSDLGGWIVDGLISGITRMYDALKSTVSDMGDNVTNWFKEKLGIHSPSVVFTELGQFTMQGLANGIRNGADEPAERVNMLARRLTAIGSGIAINAAVMPAMAGDAMSADMAPLKFDRRPPIASMAAGAPAIQSGSTINITINPPPGADPQAIAQAVSAELDRRERQRHRNMRSAMHDYDE